MHATIPSILGERSTRTKSEVKIEAEGYVRPIHPNDRAYGIGHTYQRRARAEAPDASSAKVFGGKLNEAQLAQRNFLQVCFEEAGLVQRLTHISGCRTRRRQQLRSYRAHGVAGRYA